MSQLVLIAGFKDETVTVKKEFTKYIKSVFPSHNEVWMDPSKKPRAVILLDKKLELKDIQKHFKGTEQPGYFEAVMPTQSVIVETFDSMNFGVKDKLKYLFTSCRHGGSPVVKVEQLNTDDFYCYEIFFENWDAVLKTCKQTWKVEEHTLSVTPYFECFKEPFETQVQRLIELNNANRQVEEVKKHSSSSVVRNVHKAPLKQLPPQQSNTGFALAETTQHSIMSSAQIQPENQESLSSLHDFLSPASQSVVSYVGAAHVNEKHISVVKPSNLPVEKKADQRCAKPVLEHPYILVLLHLLNFEKAVQTHFNRTTVVIDETTWEIEITGPISSVKTIQKLLTEEDELDRAEVVVKFLAFEAVQQDLKAFVESEELYLDIVTAHGKPCFEVHYGKDRKVSFHDFISSLVILKECFQFPNEHSHENIKWITFMESFDSTYSHQRIFVKDKCVILASLAHISQDCDLIFDIINNVIIQLKTDVPSVPKRGSSSAESTVSLDEVTQESLTSINSNQSSEDTKSLGTNRVPKSKKITIFSQNSALLWILNVLNFRNAVTQIDSHLGVKINENQQEIIIKGPRKEVEHLKSVLMEKNKQFSVSEHEQELLSDSNVQEHLKILLTESSCHIVLNESLEMLVAYNSGEQEQLTPFVTGLIQIKECLHLPEKYHTTEEWNSFVAYVKNSQPCFCVFTANDKVYLLSLVLGKTLHDVDSFVGKINKTISTLISTTAPEEIVGACSSSSLKDQKSSLDKKFEDEKSSSRLIPDAAEKSRQNLRIYFKHPVLPWILNILDIKKAVSHVGVRVTINMENYEVTIKGPRNIVGYLQEILVIQDNEMSFEGHCEDFLSESEVQEFVTSVLQYSEAHIVLGDNLNLFIEMRSGKKIPMRSFFTDFIHFRRCSNMPKADQTNKELETLVQACKHHYRYHIHITGEEIYVLTLVLDEEPFDADPIVQEINTIISSCTSSVSHDSEMTDDTEWHDLFFNYDNRKMQYCKAFLQQEIHNILQCQKNYKSDIEIVENDFRIVSTSPRINLLISDQLNKILSQIELKFKILHFPGLQIYLKSEGLDLIEALSNENKCHIEISDPNSLYPQSLAFSENMSSEDSQIPEYKVALLGTAKSNGFNVHLVQGDIRDLNLQMRIELCPSEEVDVCDLKTVKSSYNLRIRLPRWLATNETTHLYNLRSSFQESISLALNQAKHMEQTSIAFSTDQFRNATEYPFPADVIARVIVEELFEHFYSSPTSPRETKTCDIYICDQKNEAVIKAFRFFLKRRNTYIDQPDQAGWDNICSRDSEKCSDYRTLQSKECIIEVLSNFPSLKGKKSCFFYPIDPSLEITTCPAVKDYHFQDSALKSLLHDQQKHNPDGLLTNEMMSLKGFSCDRMAFIYSSPDWGMYSKKTIEWILDECIKKLADYEEIYIVPPGMQLLSKYPAAFLAQTWFKKLDSLLLNQRVPLQKKKITLIVQDHTYKKAFDQELQKRFPKSNEKGIMQKIRNYATSWLSNTEKENINKMTVKKTSQVPGTTISFSYTKEQDFQKAAMSLEKELKMLMNKNKLERILNAKETHDVQGLMKDLQDMPVLISITEQYEMKGKKKKQQMSLTGSLFTVQGLSKMYVNSCLDTLNLCNTRECETKLDKESAQTEASLSTKSHENVSFYKDKKSQQKHDSKLLSSKTASDDVPSHSSVQMTSYHWLYESNSGNPFQDIGANVDKEIEFAYSKELKDSLVPRNGKFSKVNFQTMTVLEEKKIDKVTNRQIEVLEKGIIRTEVLEIEPDNKCLPKEWTSMSNKKPKLEKVEKESEEFKKLQRDLEACIKKQNLGIVEVSRVQNQNLYTRCRQKLSQLKNPDFTMLWHRSSNKYKDLIWKQGFHQRFSGMPEAKHLGEGVLFCEEPDKCFSQPIEREEQIYLFASNVLLGRFGPGKQGLRCPPSDENTGEPFDSVCDDTSYMIFSDAQAYPNYVITLEMDKHLS